MGVSVEVSMKVGVSVEVGVSSNESPALTLTARGCTVLSVAVATIALPLILQREVREVFACLQGCCGDRLKGSVADRLLG